MKRTKGNNYLLLFLVALISAQPYSTTAEKEPVVSKEILRFKYFSENNSIQYLLLENLLKTGKKFEPLKSKTFQLYLDSINPENLIAKVTTDEKGKAISFLPPSLKSIWDASNQHTFLAVKAGEEEAASELIIGKAKLETDTSSSEGTRSIAVKVLKLENNEWIPASDVELKVGIRRLSAVLPAGDDESYTTDESGSISLDFTKDNLPGDNKGNIVLVVNMEDNDLFGNMLMEKTVPWGIQVEPETNFFDQRELWTTRFRTPFWLLFMAYTIVISVWGTIIYLIFQIVKIKKMGVNKPDSK